MSKLLSIIIPSYNMENYLPKCLGSVLACGGGERGALGDRALPGGEFGGGRYLSLLDVIVVNDGSTDRTSEIAHDFARRYPGVVRVIDKPNGHYGSCINAALPVAQGEYVKVLDADDTFEPAGLAALLHALQDTADDIDAILTDYVRVDEDGASEAIPGFAHFGEMRSREMDLQTDELVDRGIQVVMHMVTFRTAHLRRLGYRQTEGMPYTDNEWICIPVAAARKVGIVPVVVYRYWVSRAEQTISQSFYRKNARHAIHIAEVIEQRYLAHADDMRCSRRYLDAFLSGMAVHLATVAVYMLTASDARRALDVVAAMRRKYGFLSNALRAPKIFASTPCPITHVDWAVTKRLIRRPLLSFVRWYSKKVR